MSESDNINNLMDDNDWAIIFDSRGQVKGIFISDENADKPIPRHIIYLLDKAGVQLDEFGMVKNTGVLLH